uniref:Cliotide T21 n=2 Tax=Clitoria ternatea TaxID=43366 RepID=CYC21_CLITE|nr:RecName: Full=Cliotide T21; AltName: Full=Cyclotide cT21 [Clitoria ternatea]
DLQCAETCVHSPCIGPCYCKHGLICYRN